MKIKTAEIISLSQNDPNPEAAALACLAIDEKLRNFGIKRNRMTFITPDDLVRTLAEVMSRVDMAVVTGIGATFPSRTAVGICTLLKCSIEENEQVIEAERNYHHSRGRSRPGYCAQNCRVPANAQLFISAQCAEPGYAVSLEKINKAIICLPGDAGDISRLGAEGFDGYLDKHSSGEDYICRIGLVGYGMKRAYNEATAAAQELGLTFELCQNVGEVCISLSCRAEKPAEAEKKFKKAVKMLRSSEIGKYIYGVDTDLATEIVRLLSKMKLTVTFAESCTGGMIAKMLVDVPGSSEVFDGSLVTYSNQIKHDFLGVRSTTLEEDGAVSRKCAAQMAEGARKAVHADIGIAVTGIAGPGGGTSEKPVGLVYIAVSKRGQGATVKKFNISGDRTTVRTATAKYALRELYYLLIDSE